MERPGEHHAHPSGRNQGQVQYCGHFGYFDDPDLRCAYCGNP